jgi:hypothetical protein
MAPGVLVWRCTTTLPARSCTSRIVQHQRELPEMTIVHRFSAVHHEASDFAPLRRLHRQFGKAACIRAAPSARNSSVSGGMSTKRMRVPPDGGGSRSAPSVVGAVVDQRSSGFRSTRLRGTLCREWRQARPQWAVRQSNLPRIHLGVVVATTRRMAEGPPVR